MLPKAYVKVGHYMYIQIRPRLDPNLQVYFLSSEQLQVHVGTILQVKKKDSLVAELHVCTLDKVTYCYCNTIKVQQFARFELQATVQFSTS